MIRFHSTLAFWKLTKREAQAQVGGPQIIEALGGVLVGETIHTPQLHYQISGSSVFIGG
jgi:hypothetical protein